ncbi:UNVERIFIED_CONTAM: polar growth protein [Siphonaria sp. JEL0065]|nr:polar growth protein [Siphonaria sp. JEL0065]
MPASFDSPQGSVQYYIKCSLTFQEGMKLLRSHLDFEAPVLVFMPNDVKAKLLRSPSHMVHEVAGSSERVGYSVQIPRRILTVGEQLEVNLLIKSTPEGTRLRSLNASLRVSANYINSANVSFPAKFPRPLAETSELFPLVAVGGNAGVSPISRKFLLEIDPELALASFEAPLISVKTLFSLDIIIDNSETPNISYELPVVLIPSHVDKEIRPETPPIPAPLLPPIHAGSTTPTALRAPSVSIIPAIQRPLTLPQSTVTQRAAARHYPPIVHSSVLKSPLAVQVSTRPTFQISTDKTPCSEQSSSQDGVPEPTHQEHLNELRNLQEEQAKLSALLAEIQSMEIRRNPRGSNQESDVASNGAATRNSNPILLDDGFSVLPNSNPTEDWTVEQVADWIRQKGASEDIVMAFIKQDIDGPVLLTLTSNDLITELGVKTLGLRRKIISALDKIRT